jgi:hypothetical protein
LLVARGPSLLNNISNAFRIRIRSVINSKYRHQREASCQCSDPLSFLQRPRKWNIGWSHGGEIQGCRRATGERDPCTKIRQLNAYNREYEGTDVQTDARAKKKTKDGVIMFEHVTHVVLLWVHEKMQYHITCVGVACFIRTRPTSFSTVKIKKLQKFRPAFLFMSKTIGIVVLVAKVNLTYGRYLKISRVPK